MNAKQRSKKTRRHWRPVIYARDGNRCAYCGRVFPDDELSIDHWWPAFTGGIDHPANYVAACRPCGRLKAHLPPMFFRRYRAELAAAAEAEWALFAGLQRKRAGKGGVE
jgi:5-methylcytosine-specific restriction endonuclease McrA